MHISLNIKHTKHVVTTFSLTKQQHCVRSPGSQNVSVKTILSSGKMSLPFQTEYSSSLLAVEKVYFLCRSYSWINVVLAVSLKYPERHL